MDPRAVELGHASDVLGRASDASRRRSTAVAMTDPGALRPLSVGDRLIGPGSPVFVIAEAGVNHDGDLAVAHELIEVAAAGGADAVKFQTFDPSAVASADAGAAPYQRDRGARTQLQMLRALTLPTPAWEELASHAGERGLVFLSTAFDPPSLDVVLALGVPALKVPSGELDNLDFIELVAAQGLPLVVSTGLSTLDEVAAAVEAAAAAPSLALLHCVTAYPAPVEQSNLRALRTLRDAFDVPVGWSDHTDGSVTAVAAVALGASLLEKHITTDRRRPGPDHAASAEPAELYEYVRAVRQAEAALGTGVKEPVAVELANLRAVRRSYHATRDIDAGARISDADVRLLRPADGLPAGSPVVGRTARRRIPAGQPVTEVDLR